MVKRGAKAPLETSSGLRARGTMGASTNPWPCPMLVTRLLSRDALAYRALMLHAYEAEAEAFTSTAAERAHEPESWWTKRVADPNERSVVFGAFRGEELVGAVALEFSAKPKTRHKAHLLGMFVTESARGLGAGRALLEAALALAASREETRVVQLTVTQGNEPAQRLYESCGFRSFGVEPLAVLTHAGFKAKVHMWIELPCHAAPG